MTGDGTWNLGLSTTVAKISYHYISKGRNSSDITTAGKINVLVNYS